MKITLVRRQIQTHDTESFYFELEQPISYQPGQFLRWVLPHAEVDERGSSRYFSISSSPTEQNIMLTTKFSIIGSSFKKALKELAVGGTIEVGPALGDFILPDDPTTPILMVAGGVGITPFRSMLKYITDKNLTTAVKLIYGCKSNQDKLFGAELAKWAEQKLNIEIHYVFEESPAGWNGQSGFLTADIIMQQVGSLAVQNLYLSGPEPMTKALYEQLLSANVPEYQIKTDFFPGYTT